MVKKKIYVVYTVSPKFVYTLDCICTSLSKVKKHVAWINKNCGPGYTTTILTYTLE